MRAISLPFRIDGYGRVASTEDVRAIWAGRVRIVITTVLGERLNRPDFGSDLSDSLFDGDDDLVEEIEASVSRSFSTWLPELTLESVDVVTTNMDVGDVDVEIGYRVPSVTTVTENLRIPFSIDQ
jgi:phage baseplate assembly protein W